MEQPPKLDEKKLFQAKERSSVGLMHVNTCTGACEVGQRGVTEFHHH